MLAMLLKHRGFLRCTLFLSHLVCLGTAQDSSDPDDLTFINKWAAIGDSYVDVRLLVSYYS